MRALGEDGLQPAVTAHKLPRTSTELADGRGSRLSYIYQRLHRQVLAAGALDVVGEKAVPFLDIQNRVFGVDGDELLVESADDRVPAQPGPTPKRGSDPGRMRRRISPRLAANSPASLGTPSGPLTRSSACRQAWAWAPGRCPTWPPQRAGA